MHFFNPVPVMQLVEVVRGLQSADETVETVVEVSKKIGKTPRVVKDSYELRRQPPADPDDQRGHQLPIRGAGRAGGHRRHDEARRQPPDRPAGARRPDRPRCILHVMETLYQGFEDSKYRPSPLLKQMVDAGYLGRKSGRGFYKYEHA